MKTLVALLFAATAIHAQQACADLKNLKLLQVVIASAVPVAAGAFALPGTTRPIQAPAFCRVAGTVWPEVEFEVWLPTQWNTKFMGVGNGGQAGSISHTAMVTPLQAGYAIASTDTGHKAVEAAWALGHPQRIADFGYRGIHVMTQAAKAIAQAHYGRAPSHSYFDGCSNGGRQALMEAQRYPEDYDGIIAGDPANQWTHLYTGAHLWIVRAMDGDSYIPSAKIPVLAAAVNKACDSLDGITDGILNDPRLCHYDPSALLCKGSDAPTCLTAAQIESVRKIWNGARSAEGDQITPGLMRGGEDGTGGWQQWITSTGPATGGHASLGLSGFKYMLFEDANWDYKTFRFDALKGFDSDVDFMDQKLGPMMNATDPDLRPFQSRGGKLLQYHGWSDPDISPLTSIQYYESVAAVTGHGGNHALRDTADFYRLFMVPGMQHCGGGPGPNSFSMLTALEQWVEKGAAPERIVATHSTNGQVDRSRPLCVYPKEAKWTGSGSTDDAANFTCALPARP